MIAVIQRTICYHNSKECLKPEHVEHLADCLYVYIGLQYMNVRIWQVHTLNQSYTAFSPTKSCQLITVSPGLKPAVFQICFMEFCQSRMCVSLKIEYPKNPLVCKCVSSFSPLKLPFWGGISQFQTCSNSILLVDIGCISALYSDYYPVVFTHIHTIWVNYNISLTWIKPFGDDSPY